jgi:hypothetical protein
MADVSKVKGPSGPPEGPGKKDKTTPDADKFQSEMRKRVTEVSKVDPDEKKKRKEQAEEEEEFEAPQTGPTTPAEHVKPFSLEREAKKANLFDMGPGTSPLHSAQPTQLPGETPHRTAFFQTPEEGHEVTEDTHTPTRRALSSGPAETRTPSREPPRETPRAQQPPPRYQERQLSGSKWTPEGQKPVSAGPPQSRQHSTGTDQKSKDVEKQREKENETEKEKKAEKKKEPASGPFPEIMPPLKSTKPEPVLEIKGKTDDAEGAEEEGSVEGVGAPPATGPAGPIEGTGKKGAGIAAPGGVTGPGTTPSLPTPTKPMGPQPLTSYVNMHPRVQELFDRMVGVMTVMNMTGMTETVLTLNSPKFASSVFFGTQIIIQEFSTAPKAFNVQLNGTPQAVALFHGNSEDLMAAFQSGNYNFRINRLDTGYLAERPLFKRKEKASGDKQDQTGDSPQ